MQFGHYAGTTNLNDIIPRLEDEQNRKRDMVVRTQLLTLNPLPIVDENGPAPFSTLNLFGEGALGESQTLRVDERAKRQMAARLSVPRKFWEMMERGTIDERFALAQSVNARLKAQDEPRMLRTFEPRDTSPEGLFGTELPVCRAFLSDRYKRLDNYEVLLNVLQTFQRMGVQPHIASCAVTDRKLYLKVIFPGLSGEVRTGDEIVGGMTIGNSEVGEGSLSAEGFFGRVTCLNGMVSRTGKGDHFKRTHVGRRLGTGGGRSILLSNETRQANDTALWSTFRDVISAIANPESVHAHINQLQIATGDRIEAEQVAPLVDVLGKRFSFSEGEVKGILAAFMKGDEQLHKHDTNLTRYGLINAVTAHARDAKDYDRSHELEVIGGQILDLSPADWSTTLRRAVPLAA